MIIETNSDVIRGLLLATKKFRLAVSREKFDGIYIDLSEKLPVLVATNGALLLALKITSSTDNCGGSFFLPSKILGMVKRYPSRAPIKISAGKENVEIDYDGASIQVKRKVHDFPDWRGMFPKKVSCETAQYDPNLLYIAARAGRMITRSPFRLQVHHNGYKPGVLNYSDNSLHGLIMPFSGEQEPYEPPYE